MIRVDHMRPTVHRHSRWTNTTLKVRAALMRQDPAFVVASFTERSNVGACSPLGT